MKKKQILKKNRLLRFSFFGIILIYFLYEVIWGFVFKDPITEIAQYGQIDSEKEYECIFIRQESIIVSPGEGSIKYFVEEGEKVPNGFKIAEIYTSNVEEKDKEQLNILNQRIEEIQQQGSTIFDLDIDKIDFEIMNLVTDIRKHSKNGNFLKIAEIKDELSNKLDKKSRIIGSKSFSGSNLETLKSEKEKLLEKINNSIIELYSPKSGIISFHIDGVEEILTRENLPNIKQDNIQSIELISNSLKSENVIFNQPIFKIIDNTTWYIGIVTNTQESKNFTLNKEIKVKINNDEIKGRIENIYNNDDSSTVVVKINQHAENFHKLRIEKLQIISNEFIGLKIHKDSIFEKNGQLGVFVLDVNKRSVFKPIKIIGYKDEDVIIHETYFYEDSKRINTVKLYDEVLRNGKNYSEGEVIF